MYSLNFIRSSWAFALMLPTLVASQTEASWGPGGFAVNGNDAPFYNNFYLRASDGLFCVSTDKGIVPLSANYNQGADYNPYGVKPGPCSPPEACQLIFQSDGNLVEYYNGAAVWQSGTSGRGATFSLYPGVVYAQILDASNNVVWASNPAQGPPGGCYAPGDQCP